MKEEIAAADREIRRAVNETGTPLLTVPGISHALAAIILAEAGDVSRFSTSGKPQAFAGPDPSTNQSGQFSGTRNAMVKRGSKRLRWALPMAARSVSRHDDAFGAYLAKKLSEGKHYDAAMGHVAKKLIRVIFHLMNTGEEYRPAG